MKIFALCKSILSVVYFSNANKRRNEMTHRYVRAPNLDADVFNVFFFLAQQNVFKLQITMDFA